MAVGRELYLVATLGSILVFILLEARPVVRRMDDFLRGRLREAAGQENRNEGRGNND